MSKKTDVGNHTFYPYYCDPPFSLPKSVLLNKQKMNNKKLKNLVLICNFNQELEIGNFLNSLKKFWPTNDCIVIDDCSTEASPRIAEKSGFQVLYHKRNFGIGAAIRTGILFAKNSGYDAVTIMSANGKMDPSELEKIVNPVVSGQVDYTTGSRFASGGSHPGLPASRNILIRFYSWISSALLGQKFSDITCGFRCYRIDFLFKDNRRSIDQKWLDRYQMEYYIHYMACEQNLRILEVPVHIRYSHLQASRFSKIRLSRDGLSIFLPFFLLKLRLKS